MEEEWTDIRFDHVLIEYSRAIIVEREYIKYIPRMYRTWSGLISRFTLQWIQEITNYISQWKLLVRFLASQCKKREIHELSRIFRFLALFNVFLPNVSFTILTLSIRSNPREKKNKKKRRIEETRERQRVWKKGIGGIEKGFVRRSVVKSARNGNFTRFHKRYSPLLFTLHVPFFFQG